MWCVCLHSPVQESYAYQHIIKNIVWKKICFVTYSHRFVKVEIKTCFLVDNGTLCIHLNNKPWLFSICYFLIFFWITVHMRYIIPWTRASTIPFLELSTTTSCKFYRRSIHLIWNLTSEPPLHQSVYIKQKQSLQCIKVYISLPPEVLRPQRRRNQRWLYRKV